MTGNSEDLIPIRRSLLDAIERALRDNDLHQMKNELRLQIRMHDSQQGFQPLQPRNLGHTVEEKVR